VADATPTVFLRSAIWAWVEFHFQSSPPGEEHDPEPLRDLSGKGTIFSVKDLVGHVADIRDLVSLNDCPNIPRQGVSSR
jgi:hypothetical protein